MSSFAPRKNVLSRSERRRWASDLHGTNMHRCIAVIAFLLGGAPGDSTDFAAEQQETVAGVPVPLAADDFTPAGLRAAQQAVHLHYRAKYRELPLDVKAEYFEWELWRYHVSPWNQAHHFVKLPDERGKNPDWVPSSDCSTWNGALLAALSHKYAVTRDARTLERIGRLLRGMHFYFEVTRTPGLAARSVARHDCSRPDQAQPYNAPDGTRYYFRGDPAKGGYNQIAAGLASVLLFVEPDLPG